MKCAILKKVDGSACVVRICLENGEIIDPNIENHLDSLMNEDANILSWRITDSINLPSGQSSGEYDSTFNKAFTDDLPGEQIDIDMNRAMQYAHDLRRTVRSEEFKAIDGDSMHVVVTDEAEVQRQYIRNKHGIVQRAIDDAKTPDELISILDSHGLRP